MRKATKALLWSALVFPGSGHLYLKRYRTGLALIVVSVVAFYSLFSQAMIQAQALLERIQSGAVAPDVQAITELAARQAAAADAGPADLATVVLMICWVVGMLDAYRVGRRSC